MKNIYTLFICLIFTFPAFSQVPYYYYQVPSGTTNNLYDIQNQFSTGNSNYICGANGILLRQFYRDSAWVPVMTNTTTDLNGILHLKPYSDVNPFFFLFGNNGIIPKVSNNGINWLPQYVGVSNNIYSGMFSGMMQFSSRYIAVGTNGLIMRRYMVLPMDTSWVVIQSGTNKDLKSISYFNRYGWIAGANGTILYSIDTGNTWNPQNSLVTNNLNSISFLDSITGFAVGDGGVILKTSNGGLNWIQKTSGTTQNLNYIYAQSATNLLIAGNKTVIYSTNNGETWILDTGVPQYNLFACSNISTQIYETSIPYFVGEGGKIFKKTLDTIYHPNLWTQLRPNNISAFFYKRGVFDQDMARTNTAGFEWPKGTGKTAIYTSGFCIGAFVNGQLREAMASYFGEYFPGYCVNGNYITNIYFKIYKVNKSENAQTSWDWANWGLMVPYGAPYIDVNNNGIYESAIDTPGVKNAKETIFLCMTDANPSSHSSGEGFGGGTSPLGVEIHMTAWAYDFSGLQDVQFISYDIINKSQNIWNLVKMGIFSDPDLGDFTDDYNGCDTSLSLGFVYNADNNDAVYGINPPAVGITLLRSPLNRSVSPNVKLGMTSMTDFKHPEPSSCEADPNGEPYPAYLMLSGFKKDSTCFLDPTQTPPKKTKYLFPGDPETNVGWTEIKGEIWNCNRDSTGTNHVPAVPSDRKLILGSGANNFNMIAGESQKFVIAQLIARDSGNLKSVTKLKQLCAYVRNFYEQNFPINANQISTNIPQSFELKQNYPNPFNPSTIIRYQIKDSRFVTLKVYDVLGRDIETLVNEFQKAGTYETQFPNNQYTINQLASGVYFYKLVVVDPLGRTGDFVAVKKMILMK